eukprot:2893061-Pyramimonas_sp.AAC.2
MRQKGVVVAIWNEPVDDDPVEGVQRAHGACGGLTRDVVDLDRGPEVFGGLRGHVLERAGVEGGEL